MKFTIAHVGGDTGGGANTTLTLNGTVSFTSNKAIVGSGTGGTGGGVYLQNSTVCILSNTTVYWENNCAYLGGAIYINDNIDGGTGSGVFQYTSIFSILPNATMFWENNCASRGGAIYVQDASPLIYCTSVVSCLQKQKCFFQLSGQNLSNGIDVQLVFENNSADVAGSVLYGGAVDNCKLAHGLDSCSSGEVFDRQSTLTMALITT